MAALFRKSVPAFVINGNSFQNTVSSRILRGDPFRNKVSSNILHGVPFDSLWGGLGVPFASFGVPLGSLSLLWGALGLALALFGVPSGSLWPSLGPLGTPWVALWSLRDFVEKWTSLYKQMCLKHSK